VPRKQSTRRAPGDGALFQRADGMWVGSVEIPTADGSRKQKRVYAKDYRRAKKKLDELRDDIESGVIPVTASTTVAKWLTHWLDTIKRPHVRPATADFYSEAIRLHIVPAIGTKRLDRLTPEDVRAMLRGIKSGRNRQRAHQTLKLALKQAVIDGMLRRNVCDAVEPPKHVTKARGAFSVEAAVAVMRKAVQLEETSHDATQPRLATRWVAAFMTGGRQGELIGLEWDRVDLDNGFIDLSWQLQQIDQIHGCLDEDGEPTCERTKPGYCPQRKWDLPAGYEWRPCHRSLIWTQPKTKTGKRIVPLVEPLLTMLRQHRAATLHEPNPHNLVWHYPQRPRNPGGPIFDDHDRWHKLLQAADVPAAELHTARHTTATLLQRIGIPEEVRMQITGHSTAAAHAAYIHVDQTQTRTALEGLAALLSLEQK
jgi:integrase